MEQHNARLAAQESATQSDFYPMYRRQQVLLGLLESLGGQVCSTDFQKYLFLYTRLCESRRSYEFVPYLYGCYSFQSSADKFKLIDEGYLEDADDWSLRGGRKSHLKQLDTGDRKKIEIFVSRYGKLRGRSLIKHVYREYPYYATKSRIAEEVLSDEELVKVKDARPLRRKKRLFATIGYEGLQVEEYINKLLKEDVRLLVDVRKNPLSRKYGFSKNKLSDLLAKVGIEYEHIPELGIVSDKRKSLKTMKDYESLFEEYERTTLLNQTDAVARLSKLYEERRRIAITCFEECHTMCHRHKVAEAVKVHNNEKFEVIHL